MKTQLKLMLLLAGAMTLFFACQKDDSNNEAQGHQKAKIDYLDIKDLPELATAMSGMERFSSIGTTATTSRNMQTDFGNLNLSEILEYVNNDGKLTYSFLIEKEYPQDSHEFENLHIVKVNNEYFAYIFKYEPTEAWLANHDYIYVMEDFTGMQTHYDLDYEVIQTTEFVNGQPIDTDESGKFSGKTVQSRYMEYVCTYSWGSLCNGVPYNCYGARCGFGIKTNCFWQEAGGGGTGGDTGSGDGLSSGDGGGTTIPHDDDGGIDVDGGGAIVAPVPPRKKLTSIIKDNSFMGSEMDCIYTKLKGSPFGTPSFFKEMLDEFRGDNVLTFSIGPTPVSGATAFTKGEMVEFFGQTLNSYEIICSPGSEAASNLDKMVTLSHELMHAFMYTSMEENGLINFNSIGEPNVINPSNLCANATIVPNINLNTLTIRERWVYLLCEIYIMNGNSFPFQWTHSLFENPVFVLETYREKLEQLLITKHDWDSEPTATKNFMIQLFGANNWKQKVAEYMSWSGLDLTPEFNSWLATQNTFTTPGFPTVNDLYYEAVTKWWTSPTEIANVLSNCN